MTLRKLLTPTCLEGSPVSSLKCDRRQGPKFRELFGPCLRRQWKLILQAGWLYHGTRAMAVSRVAGLLSGSPTGAQWAWTGVLGGGLACWAATRLGGRETKLVYLKLGAIPNTAQGSLYPTHHAHIQTHTHTQGCAMGPPVGPWRCGLMARPVSGVEWSGMGPPNWDSKCRWDRLK